jgi:hypothetical protein
MGTYFSHVVGIFEYIEKIWERGGPGSKKERKKEEKNKERKNDTRELHDVLPE